MLGVVARSCWFLDSFYVDGWSIHRTLDIHCCCIYFFVSTVWVDIHFVWIYLVRFMSPQFFFFFFYFFYFFNNIYEHLIRTEIYPNFVEISSIPFLCHCALALSKEKIFTPFLKSLILTSEMINS